MLLHPSIYIPVVQGSDIYNHNIRGLQLNYEYFGSIASSLELNKLIKNGLRTRPKTKTSKLLSQTISLVYHSAKKYRMVK